jgi:hypothetical protein
LLYIEKLEEIHGMLSGKMIKSTGEEFVQELDVNGNESRGLSDNTH